MSIIREVAAPQRDDYARRLAYGAIAVVAGAGLLALSAHAKVPFWPVPMTLQTLAVLFIGLTYSPRLALATVSLYLAEGVAGLPVFSSGGGFAQLAGPTGGYLIGFALAAPLLAILSRRGFTRSLGGTVAVLVLCDAVAITTGWAWLSAQIGQRAAYLAGVLPFLPGEALKIALLAALHTAARSARRSS